MNTVKHIFKGRSIIVILFLLSLGTRMAFLGIPNSAVFDEVHFGKFISAYFTGQYYFDIHPPLGKLILAGWGWLWGFQPGFSFANIGDVFPDTSYIALRFLPALAGALLPLVIYGIARQLRFSRPAALFAGLLIVLDNALLTQSRFILLDSFLLLFGFAGIYSYLRFRNHGSSGWLAAAGALGGAAASIKWTGLSFLGIMGLLEIINLIRHRFHRSASLVIQRKLALIIAPILVYITAFAFHFALLPKSGTGDAFMSPSFQRDLVGNANYQDPSIPSIGLGTKILQLNTEMFRSNQRLDASHPYASQWYTWPFMQRSIFYWVKDTARVYLLGNPLIWWASTLAVGMALATVLLAGIRRTDPVLLLLITGWLANMLPFIGIGRVMFLYHYFPAFIWAILLFAYGVDHIRQKKKFIAVFASIATVLFIFFAPLSYGLPLSESGYAKRVWFDSWR